jgi:hypothetical protein
MGARPGATAVGRPAPAAVGAGLEPLRRPGPAALRSGCRWRCGAGRPRGRGRPPGPTTSGFRRPNPPHLPRLMTRLPKRMRARHAGRRHVPSDAPVTPAAGGGGRARRGGGLGAGRCHRAPWSVGARLLLFESGAPPRAAPVRARPPASPQPHLGIQRSCPGCGGAWARAPRRPLPRQQRRPRCAEAAALGGAPPASPTRCHRRRCCLQRSHWRRYPTWRAPGGNRARAVGDGSMGPSGEPYGHERPRRAPRSLPSSRERHFIPFRGRSPAGTRPAARWDRGPGANQSGLALSKRYLSARYVAYKSRDATSRRGELPERVHWAVSPPPARPSVVLRARQQPMSAPCALPPAPSNCPRPVGGIPKGRRPCAAAWRRPCFDAARGQVPGWACECSSGHVDPRAARAPGCAPGRRRRPPRAPRPLRGIRAAAGRRRPRAQAPLLRAPRAPRPHQAVTRQLRRRRGAPGAPSPP